MGIIEGGLHGKEIFIFTETWIFRAIFYKGDPPPPKLVVKDGVNTVHTSYVGEDICSYYPNIWESNDRGGGRWPIKRVQFEGNNDR